MGKSSKECLDIIWTDMKTGIEGREVFSLETKKNNTKPSEGLEFQVFLLREKIPISSQIYEKHREWVHWKAIFC